MTGTKNKPTQSTTFQHGISSTKHVDSGTSAQVTATSEGARELSLTAAQALVRRFSGKNDGVRRAVYTAYADFLEAEHVKQVSSRFRGRATAVAEGISLIRRLRRRAVSVLKHAQPRYSHFHLGATLLCADGTIVDGVNVESSSYGGTICAERSALVAALSQGYTKICMIVVISDSEQIIRPCGLCRQLLYDYCPDAVVVMCSRSGSYDMCLVRDLLPLAFDETVLR